MAVISFPPCTTDEELAQILLLQADNLPAKITDERKAIDGFVTVHHNFDLLKAMNQPYPHQLAKNGNQVVGYALVMCREFAGSIPILLPLFAQIDNLVFERRLMASCNYFVMGQICIDTNYRQQGIFKALYQHLRQRLISHFDYMVTEVARRNTRSLDAHLHSGFEIAHEYNADGENWVIVVADLHKNGHSIL